MTFETTAARWRRTLLATTLLASSAFAQDKKDFPPAASLGKDTTEALCARFTAADHWVQKAVVLLSLNQWWHPAGTAMVVEALRAKDLRLCAFGVEALLRSDAALLPSVATPELMAELIEHQLARSNELLRTRVLEALTRLAPKAGNKDRAEWAKWWSANKDTFTPEPWTARTDAAPAGNGTTAAAQRAFDLYQSGLDMMICIDSTGSMQPTIDALGQALGQMVDILDGLSPKLRLGVVHYKDHGELGKIGAKVLQPFTKSVAAAQKTLGGLRAGGGEDLPEAVLGGLEVALDDKNGWKKDASKVVVLIGDAPPHPDEREQAIAWARTAFEAPGTVPGKPSTGAKPDEKPILTSAIGVFLELPDSYRGKPGVREFLDSQRDMRNDFQAIAKAGGGVFVDVTFKVTDGPAPTKAKDREKEQKKDDAIAAQATRRIVEHILVLSFGERFAREMHDFVRIFYEYQEAGFFK